MFVEHKPPLHNLVNPKTVGPNVYVQHVNLQLVYV